MKNLYLFCILFLSNFSFAQYSLTVKDADNGALLPNVEVKCKNTPLGITDLSGKIILKKKCTSYNLSLTDYYRETVLFKNKMTATLSKTQATTQGIEAVILEDKSDPKALAILAKVNDNYLPNSPKSLDSYTYKSYEKISLDIDEDSIDTYNQTLRETVKEMDKMPFSKAEKKADTTVTVKEVFASSKLFLWERAQEFLYSKKYGEKIKVLDNRVSGLTQPIYEMMAIQNNRNKIPKEANRDNRDLYRYFLTDSLIIEGRPSYEISFREVVTKMNINKNKFSGKMYIDKDTYGIKKLENFRKVASEGTLSSIWVLKDSKWFLDSENVRIKLSNVLLQTEEKKETKNKNTKADKTNKTNKTDKTDKTNKADQNKKDEKQGENFVTYGFVKSRYFDFNTNIPQDPKDFKGYTFSVENADGSELEKYRTEGLTAREKNTYIVIDSLGEKLGAQRKANIFSSLLHGKLRYNMINFDVASLLNYNKYEGIRLGLNVKLNEEFHKYISPDAYIAYGFKDSGFKYGAGIDYKTTLSRVSFFRLEYFNDVEAAGRFNEIFWNFGMKISNSGVSLNNDRFYSFRGGRFSFERDLTNSLSAKLAATLLKEEAVFPYSFQNRAGQFDNFNLKLSFMYAPFSKNIMTPAGKYTTEKKFPDAFFNIEQGIESLGGEFSYTKVDVLLNHQFKTKWGTTGIRVYGGKLFGDAPIWQNFTMNGLGGSSNLNFNLASYLGFATMRGGNYFNDEFAGQYFSHQIPFFFRTVGKGVSSFNVLYRSIIGNMKNPEYHQLDFQKLDHLYQEAGLEIDNFLSTRFNLGFFYRVGHYQTDKFSDNFAIQLKLKLLGF